MQGDLALDVGGEGRAVGLKVAVDVESEGRIGGLGVDVEGKGVGRGTYLWTLR